MHDGARTPPRRARPVVRLPGSTSPARPPSRCSGRPRGGRRGRRHSTPTPPPSPVSGSTTGRLPGAGPLHGRRGPAAAHRPARAAAPPSARTGAGPPDAPRPATPPLVGRCSAPGTRRPRVLALHRLRRPRSADAARPRPVTSGSDGPDDLEALVAASVAVQAHDSAVGGSPTGRVPPRCSGRASSPRCRSDPGGRWVAERDGDVVGICEMEPPEVADWVTGAVTLGRVRRRRTSGRCTSTAGERGSGVGATWSGPRTPARSTAAGAGGPAPRSGQPALGAVLGAGRLPTAVTGWGGSATEP